MRKLIGKILGKLLTSDYSNFTDADGQVSIEAGIIDYSVTGTKMCDKLLEIANERGLKGDEYFALIDNRRHLNSGLISAKTKGRILEILGGYKVLK